MCNLQVKEPKFHQVLPNDFVRMIPISVVSSRGYLLPRNTVIVAMITRAAPHRIVLMIEENSVDGARRAVSKGHVVAHSDQLIPDLRGH